VIPTENAAFAIKERVVECINQIVHAGGTSCNLAKAFGCLNHESLLPKLHFYGKQGGSEN
jgi:hypothetical protein